MEIVTRGDVFCNKCELSFSKIEDELIVQTELGRKYIFCPSCLELIPVINTGDEMTKKPIRIKNYHIDSMKVLREISESGEEGKQRAKYIKSVIAEKRSESGLDPVDF